jgi:hypothetical protein
MDKYIQLFNTVEICHEEILNARDIFTSKTVTETQWHEVENKLAIMYLHCPKEVSSLVFSTIEEMVARRPFMPFSRK